MNHASGRGYLGLNANSTGVATFTGENSTWQNSGNLYIGGYNSGAGGNGSLIISDGGVVTAASTTIWQTGSLSGNGGTLVGNVTNYGLIGPGNSPGILTISQGSLFLASSSTLAFDIAGQIPGTEYDQLFVDGDFTIAGLFTLNFDGFTLPANDTFYDLIHVGGNLIGSWNDFDDIQYFNTFAGFDASLLGFSVVTSDVAGYAHALRLTILGSGDPNTPPATEAIPEPATAAMGLLAIGGLAVATRRRRA